MLGKPRFFGGRKTVHMAADFVKHIDDVIDALERLGDFHRHRTFFLSSPQFQDCDRAVKHTSTRWISLVVPTTLLAQGQAACTQSNNTGRAFPRSLVSSRLNHIGVWQLTNESAIVANPWAAAGAPNAAGPDEGASACRLARRG
jgi:hypothetical protein